MDAAVGERWRCAVVPAPSWPGKRTEHGADDPGGWRQYVIDVRTGSLPGVRLYLALLQASADLGARPRQTFRYVVLPLAIPGIAAGSIFTFSLTLGDFIVPQLVGPPGFFIGNMVYSQQGAIGNMPMAAAFTLVPIVLIALYLAFVKRLGAFDAL